MDVDEDKGKLNMEKIKILSILPNNQELQGGIYISKIYSSDMEGEDWLYSGLRGFLALIVDYNLKTRYICLYDPTNYQKVFQYELYKGFEKYFQELAPDFRCFEIDSGFIGLQFEKADDASNFEIVLKKITSMKNIFSTTIIKEEQKDIKNKKEIIMNYTKILKENFCYGENKYDEKYAEDGTQISNHRNFKILNNISYDKENKQFKFGKISDELKEMFLSCGIKKKDLEKDMDFAFTLFKKIIVGLGKEKKLKNTVKDSIMHIFPPPDEREKLRRQEEANEVKLNKKRNEQIKKNQKNEPKPKPKPIQGKRGSVPIAPPPPPPPPSVPTAVPKIPSISVNSSSKPKPEVSLADELKNIKLTKVEVKQGNKGKNIDDNSKNFLQGALSSALQMRFEQLHKFDEENNNDDEDDDDWDT